MGIAELADRLGVSRMWVGQRAWELGGVFDPNMGWLFEPTHAVRRGLEIIQEAGVKRTVYVRCPECGDSRVWKKGKLGREVIDQPHLVCPGGGDGW